jgi:hypothetical protein
MWYLEYVCTALNPDTPLKCSQPLTLKQYVPVCLNTYIDKHG